MSTKTIIITAVPSVLGQSPAFRKTTVPGGPGGGNRISILGKPKEMIHIKREMIESGVESAAATRKRQRLDHLSLEEKLMRRKLKNRVAAQTARDRKKAKMDELEDLVQHMELEREQMKSENSKLKNMNMLLETENTYLKEKLTVEEIKNAAVIKLAKEEMIENQSVLVDDEMKGDGALEHAALISVPQQKEQGPEPTSLLMKHLVFLQMMMSVMTSWNCTTNSVKTFSEKTLLEFLEVMLHEKKMREFVSPQLNPQMEWWGPQQRSWSPSKN